ncbi:MAG: ribosome silencing factor [Deltaproteobacteria bacterium CG23_combo_of_CG06-09_8_20_14_all_60_8]|nr:MAG: ribosome silencing factor [Desulfobacterales bacterium CG2_30_60_27]PIP44508.1 MAG: ribosome silencing factor [Deltaproteobacteria bacterium CG23_combo_of_CG06-09_8_20_14_all_60_8]
MKTVSKAHGGKTSLELARLLSHAALEKKAADLLILDVRVISSIADYFVIMSGRSVRHVQGLAEAVDQAMSRKRIKRANAEGYEEGLWILLDYHDVVVHIFYQESRPLFDLEGLWHDAPRLPVSAGKENS